jgi:hypothetical protein
VVGLLSVAALLFVARDLDVDVGVVAEARVGQAALDVGQEPRFGLASVLMPGLELELRRPDSDLRANYALRLFWGDPRTRPLVLHIANFLGTARVTRTLNVFGGVSASEGEPDFSALSALLPAAGMLPPVVKILSVSAMAGAQMAATRIWDVGVTGEVGHRRQLGTQPMMAIVLPEQTIFRVEPSAVAHLSRRDDLLLMGGVTYQMYSSTSPTTEGARFLIFTPEVGWRTHLTPRYDLRLIAGIAYLRTNLEPPPGQAGPDPVSPVGSAELVGRVFRDQGIAMQITLGATVEYYADPILAVAVPRGTAFARGLLLLGGDWSVGLEGTFGTSLASGPIQLPPPAAANTHPDETFASVSLPVRHRISNNLTVEFGGRWFDRGPHLDVPDFAFHQRQAWAYVMVTATTRRPDEGHLHEAAGAYGSRRTSLPLAPGAMGGMPQGAPGFPQPIPSGAQGIDVASPVAPSGFQLAPGPPRDGTGDDRDDRTGLQDNPAAPQGTQTSVPTGTMPAGAPDPGPGVPPVVPRP